MSLANRRDFLKAAGSTTALGFFGSASAKTQSNIARFAAFNVYEFDTEQVQAPGDEQAEAAAHVIQSVDPDVLVVNELTNNFQQGKATDTSNAEAFVENYLTEAQNENVDAVEYPNTFMPEVNTGVMSGMDLDNDGAIDTTPGDPTYANDAFGFGLFPGQYGFSVFSKHPIEADAIRTFRKFLWEDMPDGYLPTDEETELHLDESETDRFRLSSKTHADVPIQIDGTTVHGLLAHPTPPVFDGPGNFNGKRCHDEVRLLADIAAGAEYVYDDSGTSGGLDSDADYVLMGDMNAYPGDDESLNAADKFFLENDDFNTRRRPTSPGGTIRGNPYATADFDGGVEVDYVLPAGNLSIRNSSVVWPIEISDQQGLASAANDASDHHLVWADIELGN